MWQRFKDWLDGGSDLRILMVAMLSIGALTAAIVVPIAVFTGDDHKGEHCVNHILIPITSGKVTTLMPECSQWEKNTP
jgi:hypothetical protein